jgi:catechol 2,3-dioxygenase-like lactoylglutathione lyase family enzyme
MDAADDTGAPPTRGWAPLTPELLVGSLATSLRFWRDLAGFSIAYQRRDEGFAYLEHPDGAQLMLCERSGAWETGDLERPYGRGVMFQIETADLEPVIAALATAGYALHAGPRDVERRHGSWVGSRREIFVLDPDGYLVMLAGPMVERPIARAAGSGET